MRLLFEYVKKHKKILTGALVLATINQVFSFLDPQIFRLIIDNYATKAGQIPQDQFIRGVLILLLGIIGVAFVSRVAKNFQDYYVNVVTQRVGTMLYAAGVEHSFSLPYSVFEDQRSGELLLKLQKARTDAQAFITSTINVLFLAVIGIVFVLIYAFFVHWLVGALYLLIMPVLGATTFLISRKIKAAQKAVVTQTAALAGSTTETLRNVELVKSLGLENQETSRLNQVNEIILGLELKKIVLIRKFSFIQGTLINAVRSALLFAMLWLVFKQAITLGEFFSLLFYSFFVFQPLTELGNVSAQYQEARASMENLEDILKTRPEEKPASPVTVGRLRSIEFKNTGFAYNEDADEAVTGIDLKISNGESVAFVGPSGSGKTTLVKLLLGLYRPQKGELLFNGTKASEIDYEDFRKRIGYVSQETQLFAGTIRENLLFVRPEATDEDCLEALKHSQALGIIERGGLATSRERILDTKIGEGGIKISGGERQRLAIARALLRNPELIIFDEATSSLDSITEKSITETIKQIAQSFPDLITIMVAHRLSTIAHADRIFVLEKGHMAEAGSHNELLAAKNLYFALWREQAGEKA